MKLLHLYRLPAATYHELRLRMILAVEGGGRAVHGWYFAHVRYWCHYLLRALDGVYFA